MSTTIELIAAPVGMQPGGYVPVAYADRTAPHTLRAELLVDWNGGRARIQLQWSVAAPAPATISEPDQFVDAVALIVPQTDESPWVTMGASGAGVEGVLWRGDRALWRVTAAGLGTMRREPAPDGWRASARAEQRRRQVDFELDWPLLREKRRLGLAIWQGAAAERAGLKSVSPGWIELT